MNVLTLLDGDLDNANVFTLTLILLFVSVFLICIHVSLTVKLSSEDRPNKMQLLESTQDFISAEFFMDL